MDLRNSPLFTLLESEELKYELVLRGLPENFSEANLAALHSHMVEEEARGGLRLRSPVDVGSVLPEISAKLDFLEHLTASNDNPHRGVYARAMHLMHRLLRMEVIEAQDVVLNQELYFRAVSMLRFHEAEADSSEMSFRMAVPRESLPDDMRWRLSLPIRNISGPTSGSGMTELPTPLRERVNVSPFSNSTIVGEPASNLNSEGELSDNVQSAVGTRRVVSVPPGFESMMRGPRNEFLSVPASHSFSGLTSDGPRYHQPSAQIPISVVSHSTPGNIPVTQNNMTANRSDVLPPDHSHLSSVHSRLDEMFAQMAALTTLVLQTSQAGITSNSGETNTTYGIAPATFEHQQRMSCSATGNQTCDPSVRFLQSAYSAPVMSHGRNTVPTSTTSTYRNAVRSQSPPRPSVNFHPETSVRYPSPNPAVFPASHGYGGSNYYPVPQPTGFSYPYSEASRTSTFAPQSSQTPRTKPVPANQWRVSFSGDEKSSRSDLPLHEFLQQVKGFQRAEKLSDDDVLNSMIYLLQGRARRWFMNRQTSFRTWVHFEEALRSEFLPHGYDFSILSELENFRQLKTQTISSFLTDIESKFSSMSTPLADTHQVYYARRNLLPHFAMALAAHDIQNLEQLRVVGRRLESVSLKTPNPPTKSVNWVPSENFRPKHSSRSINAMERDDPYAETEISEEESEPEICYLRKDVQKNNKSTQKAAKQVVAQANTSGSSNRFPARCTRCKQTGHPRNQCVNPEKPDFCFKCGLRDVRVPECPNCSENMQAKPVQEQTVTPNLHALPRTSSPHPNHPQ